MNFINLKYLKMHIIREFYIMFENLCFFNKSELCLKILHILNKQKMLFAFKYILN